MFDDRAFIIAAGWLVFIGTIIGCLFGKYATKHTEAINWQEVAMHKGYMVRVYNPTANRIEIKWRDEVASGTLVLTAKAGKEEGE